MENFLEGFFLAFLPLIAVFFFSVKPCLSATKVTVWKMDKIDRREFVLSEFVTHRLFEKKSFQMRQKRKKYI